MATIEKRQSSTGQVTYRARVRVRGFPQRTKSFKRKTDASTWAKALETDLARGNHIPTSEAMKKTIADMIDRYIEETLPFKPRNKDKANVEKKLKWWRDEIGDYTLANVTPAVIVEKRDKLKRGQTRFGQIRSSSTVNRYLAAISHPFTTAMKEWGWITDTPMRLVSKFEESKGRVRFLSDVERPALLEACKKSEHPDLYLIVVLALSTGARKSEILNIKLSTIHINQSRIILHETKNRDRRSLPLTGHAYDLVKERIKVRRIDTELLFPYDKDPTRSTPIQFYWAEALTEAKLKDFRFHDLRHSAASYLAMNGATLAEIAEVLGHKTLAMVKRYSHLTEQHTANVVEKMNAKLF